MIVMNAPNRYAVDNKRSFKQFMKSSYVFYFQVSLFLFLFVIIVYPPTNQIID